MDMVGLYSAHLWHPLGSPDVLHCFFSTICMNLEQAAWGIRFPVLMNQLYSEQVEADQLEELALELHQVRAGLASLPPDSMVWDSEFPAKPVPDEHLPAPSAESLIDCFVNTRGERIIDVIDRAVSTALAERQSLRITALDEL